jgi:hypothetical protein
MPKILDKYVKGMKKKGMPEDKAYAIATSNLQKKGVLEKGSHELKRDALKRRLNNA